MSFTATIDHIRALQCIYNTEHATPDFHSFSFRLASNPLQPHPGITESPRRKRLNNCETSSTNKRPARPRRSGILQARYKRLNVLHTAIDVETGFRTNHRTTQHKQHNTLGIRPKPRANRNRPFVRNGAGEPKQTAPPDGANITKNHVTL
jgi:hypothetical protein